jgi:hypothetical protein
MELINSVHEYSEPQVKKLAEQAAWDFLAAKKPAFDLTVNNPYITIGPMLQPINGAKTKVSNQRIVLAAGLITPQLVINTIRKALPAAGWYERIKVSISSQILPVAVQPPRWGTVEMVLVF